MKGLRLVGEILIRQEIDSCFENCCSYFDISPLTYKHVWGDVIYFLLVFQTLTSPRLQDLYSILCPAILNL